jgi:hypothetical protein
VAGLLGPLKNDQGIGKYFPILNQIDAQRGSWAAGTLNFYDPMSSANPAMLPIWLVHYLGITDPLASSLIFSRR